MAGALCALHFTVYTALSFYFTSPNDPAYSPDFKGEKTEAEKTGSVSGVRWGRDRTCLG